MCLSNATNFHDKQVFPVLIPMHPGLVGSKKCMS